MTTISQEIKKTSYVLQNFLLRIGYNFYITSGTTRAGSLSFTLMLSFVPFMISIASIIGWLPFSNHYMIDIEHYLFANYIPHEGTQVYEQVKVFLQHSHELSWLGSISLLISSYLMLFAVENQLNALWGIANSKFSPFNSLVVYTIFILGSTFTISIISIAIIYTHVFLHVGFTHYLINSSLTTVATILLFTLCYKIFPNHKIDIFHAFIAGFSATVIFNIGKKIFVFCIKHIFVNYHVIYGSLAFFPIFLIWIYFSCLNLLFCAEIIYGLQTRFNRKLQHQYNSVMTTIKSYLKPFS